MVIKNHFVRLSTVFGHQNVALKEVRDKIWLVNFMDYDLGTMIQGVDTRRILER